MRRARHQMCRLSNHGATNRSFFFDLWLKRGHTARGLFLLSGRVQRGTRARAGHSQRFNHASRSPMAEPEKQRNPVEELAESFLRRYREGELPSITEFVARHPELAAEIRELFPALLVMEQAGARESDPARA